MESRLQKESQTTDSSRGGNVNGGKEITAQFSQ
ncbi:hypothetical protein CCACVL1_09402 [Corchorus capsularis]|uniref:Uncharacterized protein n=1 Tax=Corchorus capsularis TaxID=210143 RepID=A0A1R3IWG5_COCAP|nr:hypothetical protein CCACVL1_09402 [Corchorus capsularis]